MTVIHQIWYFIQYYNMYSKNIIMSCLIIINIVKKHGKKYNSFICFILIIQLYKNILIRYLVSIYIIYRYRYILKQGYTHTYNVIIIKYCLDFINIYILLNITNYVLPGNWKYYCLLKNFLFIQSN